MDLSSFAAYIPLGVLGLVRWASWLIRRVPASLYRPARTGHFEPLTIVVPVYQEDRRVFRQALESWLANRVEEVICVIDRTDQGCLWIAREYPVRIILTDVPGKRDALRRGWEAARTPLVALVDSDTIWAADVADRVCEPFADPRVGGVGTRQNVAEPRTVWEHSTTCTSTTATSTRSRRRRWSAGRCPACRAGPPSTAGSCSCATPSGS
jgi:cellulose synthase/poly-beta-1,6-N-acetylglucosamine synthase-like glycosyltransferase